MRFCLEAIRAVLTWQVLAVVLGGVAGVAMRRLRQERRRHAGERVREQRVRAELETYARLDARLPVDGDVEALGKRVCQAVAETSSFGRVAMLVRDADGRLYVTASSGMDDRMVQALDGWCGRVVKMQPGAVTRGWNRDETGGARMGTKSFKVQLELAEVGMQREVIAIPFWSMSGQDGGGAGGGEADAEDWAAAEDVGLDAAAGGTGGEAGSDDGECCSGGTAVAGGEAGGAGAVGGGSGACAE